MERLPGSWLRRAAFAAVLGALLLVVAVVAGTPPGGGGGIVIDRKELAPTLEPIVRVAYLALMATAFYQWLVNRDAGSGDRRSRRGGPLSLMLVLISAAALMVFLLYTNQDTFQTWFGAAGQQDEEDTSIGEDESILEGQSFDPPGLEEEAPGASGPPATSLAWLVLLGLGVGLLAAWHVSRRPDAPLAEMADFRAGGSLDPVVEAAMRDPTDPRGRVFRAYREVEVAARLGSDRAPWETVTAHLRRLPDAGGATDRLARSYNLARYSERTVDGGTAAEAEADAGVIRRELSK